MQLLTPAVWHAFSPLLIGVWNPGGLPDPRPQGQLLPAAIRRSPKLYSFARVMPALPVPDLEATVNKYVASVKPLLNDKRFERVQLQAKIFLGQEGPKLQRYLWFKWLVSPNYVTDWWEQ